MRTEKIILKMHSKEFIDTIRIVVEEATINGIKENLNNPPGRKPDQRLIAMSKWFNDLILKTKK